MFLSEGNVEIVITVFLQFFVKAFLNRASRLELLMEIYAILFEKVVRSEITTTTEPRVNCFFCFSFKIKKLKVSKYVYLEDLFEIFLLCFVKNNYLFLYLRVPSIGS